MKKIVLIDGHNLLFRMFFGIPSPIKNSKGKDIRGLVGFIGSIKKIVSEFEPYSLIVIFDSETSRDNNLMLDQSYKANRVDYTDVIEEENPFSQLPLIKKALNYLNIVNFEVVGNEADDFIASLVNNKNYSFVIVSTDSDFLQLVNENTFLYVPRGKNSILFDEGKVIEKYGITSDKYVLFKSFTGDKSDNISGISGIGPITAAKILKYETIDKYISENPNSKISNMLQQNKDQITKNEKLITMKKDIDTSNIIFTELDSQINSLKTYEIIDMIGER